MRHVRELGNILQASYSSNCERLDKPVLLLYGGGDHNVTHASVQISLLCLFLELDYRYVGCSKDVSHSELG